MPANGAQPGLSVMIPTWRPDPEYLATAVDSVLAQVGHDPSVEVQLVDDASPDFDVAAFAGRFGAGRVGAWRHERRLGLAGNWNACIERAQGSWVHLLHQDDYLLDGFYAALAPVTGGSSDIAAAFTASWFVDGQGRGWSPRLVSQDRPGVLEDWVQAVYVRLAIQCSAMVFRREAVRELGGFDPSLAYALDWDLWKRLAVRYPLYCDPRPLAAYRRHGASETSRLRREGAHLEETFACIDRSEALLPPQVARRAARRARRHYARVAVEEAASALGRSGDAARGLRALAIARRHTSAATVAAAMARVLGRACARPFTDPRRPVAPASIGG